MSQFQLPMTAAVLLYKDRETFVVHALEFDICAVENSEEKAVEKLKRSLKRHIEFALERGWEESILSPAPREFWEIATRVVDDVNHRSLGSVFIDPEKVKRDEDIEEDRIPAVLLALYRREYPETHIASR
jgi:hypothetical protein